MPSRTIGRNSRRGGVDAFTSVLEVKIRHADPGVRANLIKNGSRVETTLSIPSSASAPALDWEVRATKRPNWTREPPKLHAGALFGFVVLLAAAQHSVGSQTARASSHVKAVLSLVSLTTTSDSILSCMPAKGCLVRRSYDNL